MNSRNARRFTIADGMILVVGVAVASICVKAFLPGFTRHFRIQGSQPATTTAMVDRGLNWLQGPGSCVVVPLMLATIALRLVPPRPRWRRIVRQPGFAACLAVAASLIPGMLWYFATFLRREFTSRGDSFDRVWYALLSWTESTVIGAWVVLALSRRWRVSSDWVDRLGTFLGFYWILVFTFRIFHSFLIQLSAGMLGGLFR